MKKLTVGVVLSVLLASILTITAYAGEERIQTIPLQILADSFDKYTDIDRKAWYKTSVDGVVSFGLIDGITEDTFCPNETTDRATLVTALYRMSGSPKVSQRVPFTDLKEDWYKSAVAWAYETEVVNGTSTTTFSPDAKITREQMAAIFFRYMDYMGGNINSAVNLNTYPDAGKVSTWAEDAFSWACAEGLITGSMGADGVVRLAPSEGATRAQVATIVMRFCERYQDIFETADDPSEDNLYEIFDNVGSITHTKSNFGANGSKSALNLDYGKRWTLTKSNGVYIIKDENVEIGRLYPGIAPDLDRWKTVKSEVKKVDTTTTHMYVEKYGSGVTLRFRYRFFFERVVSNQAQNYTLTLDYTKVKGWTAQRILSYSKIENVFTEPNYGMLSNLKNKRIYFVGNSFIGYSDIPNILREMCQKNGQSLSVSWKWIPNSRITHFTKDEEIMNALRSGKYDALFLCGMYSTDDVADIDAIVKACNASGTQIVLFPAHNENASVVEMMRNKLPSLKIIDWKGEIEALIGEGRSFWSFCFDDGPRHSNSIGGYVGAHMIYRAIFGKNPTAPMSQYVKQSEVNRVLGNYVTKASARRIQVGQIKYFD